MSRLRHRSNLSASLGVCLLLCLITSQAWAQGQEITFSAIGDVPYGSGEVSVFQGYMDDHNLYSPSEFLVHVGDIKSGGGSCSEYHYTQMADMLKTLEVPAYIIIGDNEWTDCSSPSQAWDYWMTHLFQIETNFCGLPSTLAYQSVRPENFAFIQKGVLFIGINMPSGSGGNASQRLQDNADWVEYYFQNSKDLVRAAVVFGHSTAGSAFFDRFHPAAATFAKPVMYILGNGHSWKWDTNYGGNSNVIKNQVDNGGAGPPVQYTVTMDPTNPFVYNRDPWPSGTPVIDRAPCPLDGPHLAISDVELLEGDFGNQEAKFYVDLLNANGLDVSVSYTTADSNTTVNADYLLTSGTLNFLGGATQDSIIVPVIGDLLYEGDEAFFVQLSLPVNAVLSDSVGVGTILENELPPLPVFTGFSPGAGVAGDTIAITGDHFGSVTDVYFNGVASAFTIESATLIKAPVPLGAQTGLISLMNAAGTQYSAVDFVVQYKLFSDLVGSGIVQLTPDQAAYDFGAVVQVEAIPSAGYNFVEWQGDLSGILNPTNITMDGDKQVTAIFVDPTQPTIVNLNPIGDAHVKLGTTSNYGTVDHLRNKTSSSSYQSYLKFDVPVLNGLVQSATLRLYVVDAGGGGPISVYLVSNDYSDGSGPWAETTITAANAPNLGAVPIHTLNTITAGSWAEFDVTSAVSGPGIFSFGTSTPSSNSTYLSSKEGAFIPELVIQSGYGGPPPTQYSLTTAVTGQGSVSPAGGSHNEGTVLSMQATASAGWQFDHWEGALTGTTNPSNLTMDADKSVTAVFTQLPPTQYALTTAVTGQGSVNPAGGSHNEGTVLSMEATASAGWQFDHWEGALTGTTNPSNLTMDADKSVTAVFTQIPVTQYALTTAVTGQGSVNPAGGSHNEGTVLSMQATASAGWQFDHWEGALTGTTNPSNLTMDADKSVTAVFVEILPPGSTASFAPIGDAYVKVGSSRNYGTATYLRNKTSSSVYHSYLKFNVSGLSGSIQTATLRLYVEDPGNGGTMPAFSVSNDFSDGSGPWTETGITGQNAPQAGSTALAASTPLVANTWAEFDVTAAVSGHGIFSFCLNTPLSNSIYLTSKEGANPPQLIIETGSGSPPPTQYALTTAVTGQGSVSPAGGSHNEGTVLSMQATASAGWQFDHWEGALTGTTNPSNLTMDADKIVTAVFTQIPVTQYALTTAVTGQGSVSPAGGSHNEGTVLPMQATASAGWQFDHWEGALTGTTNPSNLTMDADKSVTAVFTQLPPTQYSLTTAVTGQGSVTPAGGSHNAGTVLSMQATASAGWQFDHWEGALTGNINPSNLTMDGNKSLTAFFVESLPPGASATFTAIQDAYLKVGGSSGKGTDPVMRVKTSSSVYHGFLKFNVSGLSAGIVRATLRLFVTDQGDIGPISVHSVANTYSGSSTPWDELGISSVNAPALGAPFQTLTAYSAGSWAEIDVTSEITGNGTFSFGLSSQTSDSKRFSSKEGSNAPELVIETNAPLAKQMASPELLLPTSRVELPSGYELLQNHPNPFNPSTTIRYQLPEAAHIRLVIYDLTGRIISVLVDDERQPGVHFDTWLANDAMGQPLPSGVYFYRINAGRFTATRKMMLVR